MTKKIISWDLETFLIGETYPEPIGHQNAAPVPVCMAYQIGKSKPQLTQDDMGTLVYDWLEDDEVVLLGQNLPFDFGCVIKHLNVPIELVFEKYNKGLVRDTMIREQLLALATGDAVRDPGKRYDLGSMVKKYLKKDISASKGEDAWRLRYSELYDVPLDEWPQEAIDYPLDDVTHALKVFAAQHKQRELFQSNELAQTRAAFDLHLITLNSPRVDPKQVEAFKEAHIHQVEAARAPLIKAGIMRWNKDRYIKFDKDDERRGGWSMDTKKLAKAITNDYARQGLEVPLTETGKVSAKAETLLKCQNKHLKAYGEAAADIKLMDGFLPGLEVAAESVTRRVSPRYTTILKTGRVSCSRPNLQNPPRAPGVRECFIAEDGHVFVSIDFTALEMYTLAQIAYTSHGARTLLDTLNNGLDPHLQMSATISGQTYEEVVQKYENKDPVVKAYRDLSKIFNFSAGSFCGPDTLLGNMTEGQIQTLRTLDPDRSLQQIVRGILDKWTDQWELRPFLNYSSRACRGGQRPKYICPITGRQKDLNTFCQLNNLRFQGLGADAAKEANRLVVESCYSPEGELFKHGVKLSVFIHDELLMSGPPETLREWVPVVQFLMKKGAENVLKNCWMRTEAEVCGYHWTKYGKTIEEWYAEQESE